MLILSVFYVQLHRLKISDKKDSCTAKHQDHIPCSFAYKVVCVDNKFSKDAAYKFIEAILGECDYFNRIMKKHFSKNLVLSAEEEENFN